MRRILLLAAMLTVALPAAAQASVIPTVAADTLTVTGDGAADSITLRLTSPTTLDVNGFTFERATFSKISIRSGAGDDSIRIADALTETVTIESGQGADTVVGGPGKETIAAGDNADFVHPGPGDDTVQLGTGDDTAIQGDGFDQIDGQAGKDRLQAVGSDDSEEFTLQANGVQARISRDTGPATTDSSGIEALEVIASGGPDLVDIGDLGPTEVLSVETDLGSFDSARDEVAVQGSDQFNNIGVRRLNEDVRVEGLDPTIRIQNARASEDRLTVFGRGGVDFLEADNGIGAKIAVTLDGGAGQDILDGSDAADTLLGGPDDDVVTGGKGDDVVDMGDGNDFYTRSAQDGNDRIEGGAGSDAISAVGGTGDDSLEVQGLLARTRVLHGFSGSADLGGVEKVDLAPFGGTDNVTVRDLTGTATKTVNVSLNTADLRVDTITVIGSQQADSIRATTNGASHTISGLAATVNVINPEHGEKVAIDARDGTDTIDATGIAKDKIQPILKGGAGNDTIVGSSSDDQISGGVGVDIGLMGGGIDTFNWAPGDGSDIVEGQGGTDFLLMTGSGGNDRFDVTAIGGRTRVTRDIENVAMDLGGVERLDIVPGPGGDILHVGDLSGTDTGNVDFGLEFARGTNGSDNTLDRVFLDGTFGDDTINVNGAGPQVRVTGLAAIVTTRGSDPTLDRLHIDTKPGNDSLSVTGSTNQLIGFTFS